MTFTGAELLIHLLERQGVRIVAGIPGGALLPLYDALGRSELISHVLARHEQAAGFIAQGMARITGIAQVCFATSGPGVTNVITALADAKLDSIPLVCIAGQVPQHLIGTDAFQEVPTVAMVTPIVKAAFFVRHAKELLHVIPEAFRIAQTGRAGPVLIDVPKDVQVQRIERLDFGQLPEAATHSAICENAAPQPPADPPSLMARAIEGESNPADDFDRAWKLMCGAQRPILYVGGGVTRTRSHSLLRELAESTQIPVTTTLMALGALPTHHPLNLGMLGMHAARFTNQAIEECDLLIAIGARFDDRATGKPDRFAPHAKVIHIDIDAREFGKIRTPTLAIHCDAATALHELLARTCTQSRADWLQRIRELREDAPLHMPRSHQLCSPYGIVRTVGEMAAHDAIVTTDVGQHQMWVAQAYPFHRPDRWLTSGGLGTMGFGLPAAIGAAIAAPNASVICFTGDGSLLMNIQELATLAELDLNVKIIVLDNGGLGLVRQQQTLFYRRQLVASRFAQPSRFVAIAHSFGIAAIELDSSSNSREALQRALRTEGPMLIRVPIEPEEHVLPMVAPGAANTDALDHAMRVSEA